MKTKEKLSCRLCGCEELFEVINLGYTPLADRFLVQIEVSAPYIYYDLILVQCSACGWNQLRNVVDPTILYQEDYPYDASITSTGSKHWKAFASNSLSAYGAGKGTKVLDIGSNVGALLHHFQELGAECLGIDPSATAANKAINLGINTKVAFFSAGIANKLIEEYGLFDIVTGTNVVAHVDDLFDFFSGINKILKPRGVFQFEAPYFKNLIENLQFDTIYHEHLSYLSIIPLSAFLKTFGLEIINIKEYDIHGGSLRIDIARIDSHKISSSVSEYIQLEKIAKLNSREKMKNFAENVRELRIAIRKTILDIQISGKIIAIASAPAKGMTLLHYCGLNHEDFIAISDSAFQKKNRLLPGIMSRVTSDLDIAKLEPDYVLILAWNFKNEIIGNLKRLFPNKTKFIVPIPQIEVY